MDTIHFHPMTVHFPIALLLAGFFLDVISLFFRKEKCLSKAGYYLMILGTIGAMAAFLTGEFFSFKFGADTANFRHRETHELFAIITMSIMLATSSIRIFLTLKKKEETALRWLVFTLYLIGCAFVAYTGLLGGKLVFEYML